VSEWLLCQADARRLPLADNSVSMCVTSPPYYGLRSYLDDTHPLKSRELGLEATPSEYCAAMVRVFREVKRVLHPSGTLWLNVGDSYASHPAGNTKPRSETGDGKGLFRQGGAAQDHYFGNGRKLMKTEDLPGVKPKDLLGVPWMLAFALRDDGWYLRDPIVWAKSEVDEYDELEGSAMPGSQRDRCTSAYEFVFMLSKRARYYYDPEACKTKSGAMLRNVWRINPEPTKHKHYATYPRELVRRCVLLGSSERGVCPECLAPWERVVDVERDSRAFKREQHPGQTSGASHRTINGVVPSFRGPLSSTLDWRPTCTHGHEPTPALVCDPFAGSATTGVVATALGRRFVGLDLSREYLTDQAMRRLERPHAAPIRPSKPEHHPLFDGAAP
jgi:site-specific DNA-methyltransferase (cytosine-N4-specific)